ncbi:MAG: preprotein translocase subunit SecG [Firmicutes bacterium]|uniref:Protein-export membrane protein SecG n=1 Tax=Candidatus Gallilactobacillus intestinavium TaxID=2840838 RepID=A0A9D9E524_9LACO|nr:preprotein translocase subunit SecG [Candidatus Gallilactobacillus intestinavium]
MYNFLLTALVVIAILIIIAVMMQPSKNEDVLGALSGGASNGLFSQQKSRGFEGFMQKVTVILGILFFGIALVLIYISSH